MPAPKKNYSTHEAAKEYLLSEELTMNPNTNRYEIDMRHDGGGTTWAVIVPDGFGFKIVHGHDDTTGLND
jgi:hypothetical protein